MTQLLIISPPPSSPLHLSDRLAFSTGPTRGIELFSAFLFVIFQLLFNAFVRKIIAKTLNVLFDWEGFFWQTSRCNYPHDTTVNSSSSDPTHIRKKTKRLHEDYLQTCIANTEKSKSKLGDQNIIGVTWSNWEHKQLQLPSPQTFWKFISQTNTMEEKEVTSMDAYTIGLLTILILAMNSTFTFCQGHDGMKLVNWTSCWACCERTNVKIRIEFNAFFMVALWKDGKSRIE